MPVNSISIKTLTTAGLAVVTLFSFVQPGHSQNAPANLSQGVTDQQIASNLLVVENFVSQYCLDCHATENAERDFDLEAISFVANDFLSKHANPATWEKILRRVDTRQMPPPDADKPTETEYRQAIDSLAKVLDARATRYPKPGRTGALRRLTRTEYQNAIRDLLAVEIDAADFLPKDQSSQGFDNITVENLSPLLLNRYITAAQKISRAAIGSGQGPVGTTLRIPADRSQEDHVTGLPFGTRGGIAFKKQFARSGVYEIELKLTRDRDEKVEGLNRDHQIDILLDRKRIERFTVKPPPAPKDGGHDYRDYSKSDAHLRARFKIETGVHEIAATFPKTSSALVQTKRQPFDTNFNRHRHPRKTPAIFQVSLIGPLAPNDSLSSASPSQSLTDETTPSRERIFGNDYPKPGHELAAARRIIQRLARHAFRRNVSGDDIATTMNIFDEAFARDGFEPAMEMAISSLLVNPNFLFRIETEPKNGESTQPYFIDDFELASRLSFFIWSSLPDATLLDLADQGKLQNTQTLEAQVRRMLGDARAESLINNFASQWLYLRNLDSITPNIRTFPDFDDNLRQAFRAETEHLFRHVLQNDLPVPALIDSDFTFLNERLATHYEIAGVTGSHFRKVDVSPESHRGGILRHGSILTVTSYATRTAPTIRGNWVLKNIFGTPAPPPPPDVPDLQENTTLETNSIRERLAVHRENPACASCHDLLDPVGFSLENFDAVGRWRQLDGELAVDSAGVLPDGTEIRSVAELERGILERPETFARAIAEKLFTFGLGRSVSATDAPFIRLVIRQAAKKEFRFSAIVEGIVCSDPFRMREPEKNDNSDRRRTSNNDSGEKK